MATKGIGLSKPKLKAQHNS